MNFDFFYYFNLTQRKNWFRWRKWNLRLYLISENFERKYKEMKIERKVKGNKN